FMKQGTIDDYAELLSQAIGSADRSYVTIEIEEIACMGDPEEFYEQMRAALRALNGEASVSVGRENLVRISEIADNVAFPKAKCLVGNEKVSDEEIEAHSRIIGCSFTRKVPWE